MESHVECAQSRDYVSDSSDQNSPSIKKSQKTNLHASPSMSSISSPGSTASYAIPTGSPGDSYKYKYSSRNTLSNPQKLDFEKPSGLALNNNPGIAINYDALSIEELITKKQQAKASIKQIDEMIKKKSIEQPTSLAHDLESESQDDKYSESQDSHVYEGLDFFKGADELNHDLDEEITQEEYSEELDKKIKQITNETEEIDNMSVEDLEKYSEEELKNIYEKELKKEEYVKLRNIYELKKKKAKKEATNDKQILKQHEAKSNECSQSDNENSQITTESCMSTATMMEDTIKEIHKNNVIRKIEHKNRQDTVKTILDARYNKEINFDNIRAAVEEGKSTNEQMSRIWGNYIEGETFKDEHCCYLCGGKLVNKDKEFVNLTFNKGLKPEIEHKLPAIEFYGKVHNIINREEYKILFGKWEYFINNPDSNELLLQVYNSINCNETEENNINDALNSLCDIFKEENNEEEHIAKFICLIKINLIEFAYSHHTCNQVKSNNNLRKTANKYTESIEDYLSNLRNVINKNNINIEDGQQMIGLIRSYKLQHEKDNILRSITNSNNKERIESNMRLINSLIDNYTTLCGKTPTRMIAESIRDMKKKITNKTKGKAISAQKKRIQDQIQINPTEINKIIKEFESIINQIDGPPISRKSPRSAGIAKEKFIKLYNNNNIEEKNKLIKQMNEIAPGTYKNFDEYIKYYNNNLKTSFPGIPFGGPKNATGGKKSRRLRLKSNRKTKKRCKKSKK